MLTVMFSGPNSQASDRESPFLPPLTLLVPAYNEEVTCEDSVRSLLRLDYPCYEVIICNDGSKDRTVEVLSAAFGFVRVLQIEHAASRAAMAEQAIAVEAEL